MSEAFDGPPRILHIVRVLKWVSGTARVVADVVAGTDRARFDPFICEFDPTAGDVTDFPKLDAACIEAKMRHSGEAFHRWDWRFFVRLLAAVYRERIAVIHSHCLEGLWYGVGCKLLSGVRLVHTHQQPQNPKKRDRGWTMRRLAGMCDAFVAVSHTQGTIVCRRYSVDPRRVSVVYNAVDCRAFQPDADARKAVREELGVAPDCRVIGAVGRFVGQKNFHLMIRAFRRILDARPECLLVIAGDGPDRPAVEALARELGVHDRIRFLGRRSDVPRLMNGFDLFLSTAASESFGIVFAEAEASGVPVVATTAVVAPEIVNDGVGGVVVDREEPEAISRAVLDLLADPARRREIAGLARQWAVSNFSTDRMADRYQQIYERCLGGRPQRGSDRLFPLEVRRIE